MAGKTYRYSRGGRVFTSLTPLTVRQLDTALVKAKAKTATQVPVYDSTGQLVGLVDQDAITAIAAPMPPAGQKPQAAAPAPAPAAAASADQAAEAVTKSVFGATFRDDGASTRFVKAVGNTEDRWTGLLKSIDPRHGVDLQRQVAVSALRFVADGMSSPNAVALAKRLGLDVASAEQARQIRLGVRR